MAGQDDAPKRQDPAGELRALLTGLPAHVVKLANSAVLAERAPIILETRSDRENSDIVRRTYLEVLATHLRIRDTDNDE